MDTNIISGLRKACPHGGAVSWFESKAESDLFVSTVTLGELQAGVELTREQDAHKADQIERRIDKVVQSYQVLSMDAPASWEWGKLMNGQPDSMMEDAMIAATARIHRLKVVTRNVKDFQRFDASVVNPFS